ncbi:MAG: hypothetical protein WCD89_06995 [Anaerocolumna sp.]
MDKYNLSDSSYVYRHSKGGIEPPSVFGGIQEGYLAVMADKGLKPATIGCRRIFAA